ncbi:MAG: hypothetical protein ACPGVO_01065 [Spirulinaceae cyanobacterium]
MESEGYYSIEEMLTMLDIPKDEIDDGEQSSMVIAGDRDRTGDALCDP